MIRLRHKMQIAIPITALILILGVGCIDYFLPSKLLIFVKISYFIGLLLFLGGIGRPIHQWIIQKDSSQQAFLGWILKVFLIELGVIALFILQKQVLLISLVNGDHLSPPDVFPIIQHFMGSFFSNYDLYPWPLIIITSAVFAHASRTVSVIAPWSALIPKKFFSPFTSFFTQSVVNFYGHITTRLFLSWNLMGIVYFVCLFIGDHFVLFMPIGTILSSFLLCAIFLSKLYKRVFFIQPNKEMILGKFFMHFFIAMVIVTLLAQILTDSLVQLFPNLLPLTKTRIIPFHQPRVMWELLLWSWWILGLPFIGSLLLRISRGRHILTFLIGTMILPTIMFFTSIYLNQINFFEYRIAINRALLNINLFAIIFFFVCLFLRGSQTLIQTGGYSLAAIQSKRRLMPEYLWQMPVCLIALWGIGGTALLQALLMLAALPALLIFILFSFWGIISVKPNS